MTVVAFQADPVMLMAHHNQVLHICGWHCIAGMRYVVDAGRSKQKILEEGGSLAQYDVRWISKASAQQRAGRSGRTGPGHCYRSVFSRLLTLLHMSLVLFGMNPVSFWFYHPALYTPTPTQSMCMLFKALALHKNHA